MVRAKDRLTAGGGVMILSGEESLFPRQLTVHGEGSGSDRQ
jgi:hypothetical protein